MDDPVARAGRKQTQQPRLLVTLEMRSLSLPEAHHCQHRMPWVEAGL